VANPTRGKNASTRQVKKRETGMGSFRAIHQVYRRTGTFKKTFQENYMKSQVMMAKTGSRTTAE
jgi:hypothetical protein